MTIQEKEKLIQIFMEKAINCSECIYGPYCKKLDFPEFCFDDDYKSFERKRWNF